MNELLNDAARVISYWLEAKLPALGPQWWTQSVVNRLTFQQQRLVEERAIQSFAGLDLAAMLRVLDQNWNELALTERLPREARSWVKELQSVRNRWAHAPSAGLSDSDAYRDADTLERLLKVVDGDDELLRRVGAYKVTALGKIAPLAGVMQAAAPSMPATPVPEVVLSDALRPPVQKFAIGQLVCIDRKSVV